MLYRSGRRNCFCLFGNVGYTGRSVGGFFCGRSFFGGRFGGEGVCRDRGRGCDLGWCWIGRDEGGRSIGSDTEIEGQELCGKGCDGLGHFPARALYHDLLFAFSPSDDGLDIGCGLFEVCRLSASAQDGGANSRFRSFALPEFQFEFFDLIVF